MPGKRRFLSQEQAETVSTFSQTGFTGGLATDRPASEITNTELAKADNIHCFPGDVRGRSGSQAHGTLPLPGSGTVHNLLNHSIGNNWIVHRADKLYRTNNSMTSSWTELTLTGSGGSSFGIDSISKIIQNKDDYVICTATGIYNILFSDTGNDDIVYRANGPAPTVPINGRGDFPTKKAHVYRIVYTYVRLTGTTTDGRITPGAVLEQETGSVNIDNVSDKDYGVIYTDEPIDETNALLPFNIAMDFTASSGADFIAGANPGSESYNLGDSFQVSSTTTLPSPLLVDTTYYAIPIAVNQWKVATTRANAFADVFIDILDAGTGTHTCFPDILNNFGDHHTHIGVYITGDLGTGILDPTTNTGFNPEVYAWIADLAYVSPTASPRALTINTPQEVWAARVAAGGFVLRTRQFSAIPDGEVGLITGGWFLSATRDDPVCYYSQITDPDARGISLGYHNIGFQSHKLDDGIKIIIDAGDYSVIGTFKKTYMFRLTSFLNVGITASVFQLTAPLKADDSIGIVLYSTVSQISESRFIAVCSDSSVRIFDTVKWGSDLSLNKVKETEIKKIEPGAVGAYYQGAYYLWYSKDSGDSSNVNTLRLAIEDEAGEGWTTYTGADWIKPHFNVIPTISSGLVGLQIFFVLDFTDEKTYRIETFDGPIGSALTKTYLDKQLTGVISSVKSAEVIGIREANRKEVQEAHAYIRPQIEADGLPSGFEIIAKDYIDGSITATETITDVPYTGDIEFFKEAAGARLQVEFITNSSDFRLTGIDFDFIEKRRKKLSPTITQTDEAGFQEELATGSFHIWVTRYDYTLNRGTDGNRALNFKTLNIETTTGPDGKSFSAIHGIEDEDLEIYVAQTITFDFDKALLGAHNFSFWVKDPPIASKIVEFDVRTAAARPYVEFDDATTFNYSGLGTVTIDDVTTGAWNSFWVTRNGATITVFQNGVSKGTITISPSLSFGGKDFKIQLLDEDIEIYDARFYQGTVKTTPAILHYYNDVVSGGSLYQP